MEHRGSEQGMQYITMALEKRSSEYETMGELFENMGGRSYGVDSLETRAILHKASF